MLNNCLVIHMTMAHTNLYSLGKIFSQSLHSCTGSSLSSCSCLKSSLSESKMELLLQEYFWCCLNSSFEVKSSSQCSQRYICSSTVMASNSCLEIIIIKSLIIRFTHFAYKFTCETRNLIVILLWNFNIIPNIFTSTRQSSNMACSVQIIEQWPQTVFALFTNWIEMLMIFIIHLFVSLSLLSECLCLLAILIQLFYFFPWIGLNWIAYFEFNITF